MAARITPVSMRGMRLLGRALPRAALRAPPASSALPASAAMSMSANSPRMFSAGTTVLRAAKKEGEELAQPASPLTSQLGRTGLHDFHLEHGAKMVPFAGYVMPLTYADVGQGECQNEPRGEQCQGLGGGAWGAAVVRAVTFT